MIAMIAQTELTVRLLTANDRVILTRTANVEKKTESKRTPISNPQEMKGWWCTKRVGWREKNFGKEINLQWWGTIASLA